MHIYWKQATRKPIAMSAASEPPTAAVQSLSLADIAPAVETRGEVQVQEEKVCQLIYITL